MYVNWLHFNTNNSFTFIKFYSDQNHQSYVTAIQLLAWNEMIHDQKFFLVLDCFMLMLRVVSIINCKGINLILIVRLKPFL